jgi:chromate transport protein ChrA
MSATAARPWWAPFLTDSIRRVRQLSECERQTGLNCFVRFVPGPRLDRLGGPAMVAYTRAMAVGKWRWLDSDAFDSGVALCHAIPGATAMQTAAYVGLRVRGVAGAAASFVGFGLPAFVLLLVLSALYERTHEIPIVRATHVS